MPDHQPDHRHLNERLARLYLPFVVLSKTPIPAQPPERPLHDPSFSRTSKLLASVALDDLDLPPSLLLAPSRKLLTTVCPVRPDLLQAGHQRPQPGQKTLRSDPILYVGEGDVDRER